MQLEGRRAVVTGGARGIGAAVVRGYVEEGATVVALDVIDEEGEAVCASLGERAAYVHCDVSSRASVDEAFESAVGRLGGLDVLVHMAGISRGGPPEDITDETWDQLMSVNARGTMLTNQAAFRAMRENGGRIVNAGSDAAIGRYPDLGAYAASKGAVIAWTRCVAYAWAQYGITVNTLLPAIWTPMYDEIRGRLTPEQLAEHDAKMVEKVPVGGRLGDAERHLVPALVFLATEGAGFITGQLIPVNGGQTMSR